MKGKKWIFLWILLIIVILYSITFILTDAFYSYKYMNYVILTITIVIGVIALKIVLDSSDIRLTPKNKIYKALISNSDTLYIMLDSKSQEVIYMSDNVENVLGIQKNGKNSEDIVYQIINIPLINSELSKWDKQSIYTSGMIEYEHPSYNCQMWIRIKIYPVKEKKNDCYVIEIVDVTKEHDRQHLLISQATNIKTRENVLNQITEKSYDFEISINLNRNAYELKYFKKDNLYFGEEKRGLYTEELDNILNYINEKDRSYVFDVLNIDSLREHFDKYELDSVTIRYRLGNEIKNNTWLESTIFFLSDRQRNNISILTKNVTENAESIREQNIMLQNALNESRMASKSKTELIATISHDIRTPLTNIVGLSETLLGGDLADNVRDDIKNIKDSSNEMLSIIDGLLDVSNIEKKVIAKQEKNYSILKMFKKIETAARDYMGNKPIKLNVNLDNNLPVILYGDYVRITRAINEIVNNAIKYTNEGSIDINARGKKQNDDVYLIVEVKDTGKGIEEERINTIMNDDSNKGISSVKKLVKLLDGKFEIESIQGEYTKVTISFVQKIVEDNKVREMLKNNREAETFSLKGKNVLIVDDNELNLKVTGRLLSSYELGITLVGSGQECIECVKEQNNYDLILMDQMMPGMDGIETLNYLKQIEGFNTPVIVLTADAMQGQKEKYLENGFDGYLSKPIDKMELSKLLEKYLKQ